MSEPTRRRTMETLAVRAATGLPLAAGVLLIILFAPLWVLGLLIAGVACLGMYEYTRMVLPGSWNVPAIAGVALTGLTALAALAGGTAALAALMLSLAALGLITALTGFDLGISWENATRRSWGLVYVGGLFAGLTVLAGLPGGRVLLIFSLFVVIAADVGAYFAGHMWGKRKLAPAISPGKTIEGVAGGAAASAVLGAVFAGLWLPDTSVGAGALLGLVLALVSVGGDLLESALKRTAGVKDSGVILPGHGGLLDRVDGILVGGAAFLLLRMLLWA
ncbi:MAG: phosphatidate cytidylyltransferase [Desulfarculaceae bacterium]|nr:phosphatidate cytidylyltransferase [Desulfarculaceae bacterium]MCF8046603.1 phosphatidate cytidylyltransferase [Desulfarculaceae bacterium]MCF8065025.1 phosphatidate cytidylyltransferase [Desulfarculaceae bacterium]MCF8098308.1 phosphatidate cytidylyltransferase [Desulfarculaceae bacterium]MCF8123331.1 phosphatidate cytidylyltransferase [Desulfarculaceae bacterium]